VIWKINNMYELRLSDTTHILFMCNNDNTFDISPFSHHKLGFTVIYSGPLFMHQIDHSPYFLHAPSLQQRVQPGEKPPVLGSPGT